jgi:hypothetical protein
MNCCNRTLHHHHHHHHADEEFASGRLKGCASLKSQPLPNAVFARVWPYRRLHTRPSHPSISIPSISRRLLSPRCYVSACLPACSPASQPACLPACLLARPTDDDDDDDIDDSFLWSQFSGVSYLDLSVAFASPTSLGAVHLDRDFHLDVPSLEARTIVATRPTFIRAVFFSLYTLAQYSWPTSINLLNCSTNFLRFKSHHPSIQYINRMRTCTF